MNKEKLRKLRRLNATDAMMEKAAHNVISCTTGRYGGYVATYKKYKYAAFMRCQHLNGILKVAVFMPDNMEKGIRSPRYEIFINPEGSEWITRELDESGQEKRWLTAMVQNLDMLGDWVISRSQKGVWINHDGMDNITRELGERKHGRYKAYSEIEEWQQSARDKKIEEKEKKEQEPWDADMALIPELPKTFGTWMQQEVLEDNFIFYTYPGKTGYCMHCGKDVALDHPLHRKLVNCPSCKKKSQLIATGRIREINCREKSGVIIQKIRGGIVIRRAGIACHINTSDYRHPEYKLEEYKRTLVRGADMDFYWYESYKGKYDRWCKGTGSGYHRPYYPVYKRNLPQVMKAIGQQSSLPDIQKAGLGVDPECYLCAEREHPIIERVAKAGMPNLAVEFARNPWIVNEVTDEQQSGLAKGLRIDGARMKRLMEIGDNSKTLLWLQKEKRQDTVWRDETIGFFVENKLEPKDVAFALDKMSPEKIYNYIKKQDGPPSDVVDEWDDYLNMAKKLKMPVEKELVYRPKDLKKAHAEAIELLERDGIKKTAEKVRKTFPEVDKVCATLEKYEYTDGAYCIRAPEGVYDIVREGTLLHHCIHTCDYYFDRISRRESYLLFLRKTESPDAPWYTLEVEPGGNIRQKRTTGDCQNKDLDDAMPFLKKWQQEVAKRISKEDRKLAEESEQKRKDNYKGLREKGNVVWHGKLAGKLLADVLETDFMPVGG